VPLCSERAREIAIACSLGETSTSTSQSYNLGVRELHGRLAAGEFLSRKQLHVDSFLRRNIAVGQRLERRGSATAHLGHDAVERASVGALWLGDVGGDKQLMYRVGPGVG